MSTLLQIKLRHERDAVAVRQAARHTAGLLGFDYHDQIRITTAVSELVRAAMGEDGGDVLVEFLVTHDELPQRFVLRVTGENLAKESNGNGQPHRPDGKLGAQRLLQRYDKAATEPATVALARALPKSAPIVHPTRAREIRKEIDRLDTAVTEGYLVELKQQNRELSSTLFELERKQEELTRLNAELADTNRGVMALYAELDERANHLRKADEIKTKFLSNMSHEFRTPLNSIRTLSKLLLDETDGTLNSEQLRQVQLIHGAAAEMFELVSDLLDLAKVEAGKNALSVGQFTVASLFSVLRGMMRPLLRAPSVTLEFDEGADVPAIVGDEGKVAQVLRNFLSNAVKYTERGSITVNAEHLPGGAEIPGLEEAAEAQSVLFCVTDTGIGIRAKDQEFIFEEFTQVRHELQRSVRGTGLGLPLCRKLAALMGGRVWVDSEYGVGSRFYLLIPRFYRPSAAETLPRRASSSRSVAVPPQLPLLVVSEIERHRRELEQLFAGTVLAPICVGAGGISADYLEALSPEAAVIDVSAGGRGSGEILTMIGEAGIPMVSTNERVDNGTTGCVPLDARVADAVYREIVCAGRGRVLIVDDDERFCAVLLKYVHRYCPNASATSDPRAALAAARAGEADYVVLDLMMPDLDGLTVLARLRNAPATAALPVLACSSKALSAGEHRLLEELRAPFLSKDELDADALLRGLVEARAWSLAVGRERARLEGTAG